ncbi:MAG: arginyltransferase, partial [Henriciella sp.]
GLSMVYTFFNPEDSRRSLGSYMILDHIMHARELGLPHTYLGYWIKDSDKMNYKSRFKPLEILDGSQWRRMRDDEQ